MPTIRFAKNSRTLTVSAGENLMQALLKADIPVASSCGGDAVCGKCKVKVLNGAEQLAPISSKEEILHRRLRLANNERLACQLTVPGNLKDDLILDTAYW